jgi:CheY-like chemotaxis protein
MQPRRVDLSTVVGGTEKMLRRLIGEDVESKFVLASDLGKVLVDPGQVEQVVMNLVVNARDAMPNGGKLTIETSNVLLDGDYACEHIGTSPGPHVMLAVSDNGTGMDGATQARIFDPFFTTKDVGKGTGLGLSTVFGIVKQSGGSIWVYSEVGVGTTFKIYLPHRQDEPVEKAPPPEPPPVPRNGSETVLLVEDDEDVRELVRTLLMRQGYQVLDARTGEEAIAVLERHPGAVHLMLTDVVMPKMSGREVADRVKALRPSVRVLYMSGYTDHSVIHHGVLEAGVAFLQKPITPSNLMQKVREVLDRTSYLPPRDPS